MKKLLSIVTLCLMCLTSKAQTSVNPDGSLRYRANVAVLVTSSQFTFENGVYKQQIKDETAKEVESAINAFAMQQFADACCAIVNRNNTAYNRVKKLLEEQKLEDYIDGYYVQAKGEGADILFLTDITDYIEEDVCQTFLSCRLIDIEDNRGWHYSMKTEPYNLRDSKAVRTATQNMIEDYKLLLQSSITEMFPEQYGITKLEGKKYYLAAFQPTGRILPNDVFYAFEPSSSQYRLGEIQGDLTILKPVAMATQPSLSGGLLLVKADKSIPNPQNAVFFKNLSEPMLTAGTNRVAFFPLSYNKQSYDGFIKNRVNNAVYDAVTRHPGAIIIEQEHLPELKQERELQKTEDFIDGHVVEQMKAIGAEFILHLDDFVIDGAQVSLKLQLISVAQNIIAKDVDVITSIDNIESEMYKQICDRFATFCNVPKCDKKTIEVASYWCLKPGDEFIVEAMRKSENPLTGESSFNSVDVCRCSVNKYMGNYCTATVKEILSKDDYEQLKDYSSNGATMMRMDGSSIKSNTSRLLEAKKKADDQQKKEKRKAALSEIGNRLMNATSVTVE